MNTPIRSATQHSIDQPGKSADRSIQDPPASIFTWLVFTIWILASILPPLIFWPPSKAATSSIALMVILLIYSSIRLGQVILSNEPRPATAMFWFFVYVTAAAVPIAQAHTGLYPYFKGPQYLTPALLIALTACISFDTGGHMSKSVSVFSSQHNTVRIIDPSRLKTMALVAVPATLYFIIKVGGPGVFFLSRKDLADGFTAAGYRGGSQVGSAFLLTIGQIPVLITFTAWMVYLIKNPSKRTLPAKLGFVILFALNLIVSNPVSNARYWFLTAVIGLIYSLPRISPAAHKATIILAVLAALVLFPYSDYFRATAATRTVMSIKPVAVTLSTKDFDQMTMTGDGVWYAQTFGHTDGRQFLGLALSWVPRSVWPSKPIDTGVLLGRQLPDAGTTNLSSPMWIEFYLDGSFPAVILGFLAFGFAMTRLDIGYVLLRRLADSRLYLGQVLLPFLAGFSLILLRGPLLQAMSRLVILLLVFYFISRPHPVEEFN